MPLAAPSVLVVLGVALAGCSGGADIGETCNRHSDCGESLQCVQRTCAPRCLRAPDCGDGYACDERGFCVPGTAQAGASCTSEVECAPGLSCRLQLSPESPNRPLKRCTVQTAGAPPGAECAADGDCRNGTCALGRCVDLCRNLRDCAIGTSCMQIPHAGVPDELFGGCMVASGVVSWTIPPAETVLLPVPSGASHASLVLSTAPPRTTGATSVISPRRDLVFLRCPGDPEGNCDDATANAQFYANQLRHRREVGTSVLAIPSTSLGVLETGAYRVHVKSFFGDGSDGPPPSVTAVVRFGTSPILDLHFHFLDLDDHPCEAAFGGAKLDQASAQVEAFFQKDFLGTLEAFLKNDGGITLGTVTYEDVSRPDLEVDLDGPELANAGALLRLGKHARGINVFFVRNLSPVGIQAYAPLPGAAGLAGTPRSGIIISLDTLCYRSWQQLARLTTRELARYMGLYQNVEIGGQFFDAIDDSDGSTSNLMFYSELGGTTLSGGQRGILHRSPALR